MGTAEPEEEIIHDPFILDMDFVNAIRLVQKNERGRQGRMRIMLILKQVK
jgi:phage anti-repressor protein